MANPTTNFGWVMPTSTSLVTNLPADFNTFGQAVDTSMAQLKGGTTGQILSKTSATDMAFTWITNDVGDITAVTAGTGITGGGTSGAVTITNDMATTITTAGDLIKGTGSGTYNRLGIGTTGQVLTVASGAPTWATPASSSPTYVGALAYSNASQSIANATNTAILLQAESFDTDSFHSTSSNTSRMTIPTGKSGKYLIQGALLWQNGTSGARTLGFFKNGSNVALWDVTPSSSTTWSFACSMTMDLVASDYVELYAVQQSGGAVNVYGTNVGNGTSTFFSVSLLGA